MCDTFIALSDATATGSVFLAKNADTEINEAQAFIRLPRCTYPEGAMLRATHIVIPQARETHEVLLDKSFWTWGGEIGFNEHGVAIGNEALFTTANQEEDGLITGDLLRLMLERASTCEEAIDVIADVLGEFGQGGNCELRGNSHFDSSYLVADHREAYVIETAGRDWFARKVASGVASISNGPTIRDDWHRSSVRAANAKVNFTEAYADTTPLASLGSVERQRVSHECLAQRSGEVTVRDMADVLRQHGNGYDPAKGEVHTNICMHAGPPEFRLWQATGALITDASEDGCMAWTTATSGTCVSIFKPVFFGMDLPHMGPIPRETDTPGSLWWKHERLHRRVMADFHGLAPEIRAHFETIEDEWFAESRSALRDSLGVQHDFMQECWRRAEEATDHWIGKLERRNVYIEDQAYRGMWDRFNRAASVSLT